MKWPQPVVERRDGHVHVQWPKLSEALIFGVAVAVVAQWVLPGNWFYAVVLPPVFLVLVIEVVVGRRRNANKRAGVRDQRSEEEDAGWQSAGPAEDDNRP